MSATALPTNTIPTIADLDAAYDAATACLEAEAHARAWFCFKAPPRPAAALAESFAHFLQGLCEAVNKLPLLRKVEHYLVSGLVLIPGGGVAATAHGAAFEVAERTRRRLGAGLGQALTDEFFTLANAVDSLAAAKKKIDKEDKALCDEYNSVLPIFQRWTKRAWEPLTDQDIAACWRPTSWKAIQTALGDPLVSNSGNLNVLIYREYLLARKAICAAALPVLDKPTPRLTFDTEAYSITLDGTPYQDLEPETVRLVKAIYDASPKRMKAPTLKVVLGMHENTRVDRILKRLPEPLKSLVHSANNGYCIVFPVRSPETP
jgi:hypothetical protein